MLPRLSPTVRLAMHISTRNFSSTSRVASTPDLVPSHSKLDTNERRRHTLQVMAKLKDHFPASPSPNSAATDEFTMQDLQISSVRFLQGDVYAPNDLSLEEYKARRFRRRPEDAFDMLGINPITQYKNYNLLSEYVTSMGRIMHSRETGLRPVNQRRMAKAIRRAVGIGFLPSTHRHPEILKKMEELMVTGNKTNRPRGW